MKDVIQMKAYTAKTFVAPLFPLQKSGVPTALVQLEIKQGV